jgi:hypothetical protein
MVFHCQQKLLTNGYWKKSCVYYMQVVIRGKARTYSQGNRKGLSTGRITRYCAVHGRRKRCFERAGT